MLPLYNTALLPLRLGLAVWAALTPHDAAKRLEWSERRARRLPTLASGGAWIHGASMGEALIARGVAKELRSRRPGLPLAVSAYTTTGREQLPAPPAVDAAFFMPLDFPGLPSRLLEAVKPAALALVETELWPNLLHEAYTANVPVVVINGRISPRRMSRYRRLGRLYRPLLERVTALGAQSEADAERLRELGARDEALQITGNVKYDLPVPDSDPAALRNRLQLAAERPVFVAGSTAPDEEQALLEAFELVRRDHPRLLLVLAPRHVTRSDEVARLIDARGLSLVRFSTGEPPGAADVLLLDTLGDLNSVYPLARVAFVGGSLVPVGGHNVLEPAAVGVPVLFGPHTEHFRELVDALVQAGGGARVSDAPGLAETLGRMLSDERSSREMGERGRRLVEANRGALERSVSLLLRTIDEHTTRSTAGVT